MDVGLGGLNNLGLGLGFGNGLEVASLSLSEPGLDNNSDLVRLTRTIFFTDSDSIRSEKFNETLLVSHISFCCQTQSDPSVLANNILYIWYNRGGQ